MTNEKYIDPAEEAAIMDAAEEYMLFAEIDEIAADLADLNPEQLHAIRMLTNYFKGVTKK